MDSSIQNCKSAEVKPCKLFVGNIPREIATVQHLTQIFFSYGLLEVGVLSNRGESGAFCAFILLRNHAACMKAIEQLDRSALRIILPVSHVTASSASTRDVCLNVRLARGHNQPDSSSEDRTGSNTYYPADFPPSFFPEFGSKVFVGSISKEVTEEGVVQFFHSRYPGGQVVEVHVMVKRGERTGDSCAFVVFSCQQVAQQAIADLSNVSVLLPGAKEPCQLILKWPKPGTRAPEFTVQQRAVENTFRIRERICGSYASWDAAQSLLGIDPVTITRLAATLLATECGQKYGYGYAVPVYQPESLIGTWSMDDISEMEYDGISDDKIESKSGQDEDTSATE